MPIKKLKRGEVVATSFTCPAGVLQECERRIVHRVRDASGWKVNRSRLVQALLSVAADNAAAFNAEDVVDQRSFEKALRNAISKGGRVQIRRR